MTQRSCRAPRAVRIAFAGALVCFLGGGAAAQSNLSVQGFGFPTGQLSTRATGSAGSISELDPLSPVNPASVAMLGARTIYFQIEPEFRSVTTANGDEHTTTARYPNVFGAIPVGRGWVVSLGASTLLDRTSTTIFNSIQHLNAIDSVTSTTRFQVDGAINDVRFAAGWSPTNWLRVGFGVHGITGRNLVTVTQSFAESTVFHPFSLQRVLGFSGTAGSAGIQLVSKVASAGLSYRKGGTLRMSAEDTTLTSAHVPDRFGASLAYTGIANSYISVSTSRDKWSALEGLGSSTLKSEDAWDTRVGADIAGPRVLGRNVFVRAGFRDRTLPFQAAGATVHERSVSAGLGAPFANGRVLGDFAVTRANRTADIAASEHAWALSFGLSVRP